MRTTPKTTILAALIMLGFWAAPGALSASEVVQLAQGKTCSSYQAMCAKRCKQRVPDDKNCVSDHCTPKLATCREDGCWQEGRAYGGKRTCGLVKS